MAYLLLTASNAGCLSIGRRGAYVFLTFLCAPLRTRFMVRDALFLHRIGVRPKMHEDRLGDCSLNANATLLLLLPCRSFPVECDRYQLATLLSSCQHTGGLMINFIRTRIIFNVRRREICPSVDRRMAQKKKTMIIHVRNILPYKLF